ncbi:MAG TPA: cytochrome c oxidase assembly factor Coa1 family protein [Pseudoxanthomonas sp.]|nr:cytochrome c oxidase assembly factor Coa1 family protein [Pseudoxanthomonas sp.]
MNAQPPSLHSAAPTRNWWERNWKWFVPTLIVTGMLCIAGFIALVFGLINGLMRSSEPYQTAMERAQTQPQVIAALGEPITAGWLVQGNISTQGTQGSADLAIPLSGPRGKGVLYVVGEQAAGQWHYEVMVVRVPGQAGPIELRRPQEHPVTAPDHDGSE